MKITIQSQSSGVKMVLPVTPPLDQINPQFSNNNQIVTMQDIGEVLLPGKKQLISIQFTSHFPSSDRSYCQVKPEAITYYVDTIKRFVEESEKLVVDFENFFSLKCIVESFSPFPADGVGDVKYMLTLKEIVDLTLTRISMESEYINQTKTYRSEKKSQQVYVVRKGDYLIKIAKKVYGDDSRYKEIAEANGITNPNRIYEGQKLVIP